MIPLRVLLTAFLCLPVLTAGEAVLAQNCTIIPNSRATLVMPEETSPTLWSMNEGDKNLIDRFVAGAIDGEDHALIVAGERYYDEGENVGLTLRKLDARGRTIWEKIYNNKGFERIIKLIVLEKGFLVLASKGGRKTSSSVWIGFFDGAGSLLKEKAIKPPKGALSVFDMIALNNAKSFLLAGQVLDGGEVPYTVLYRLDRNAGVVSQKAYQMGLENALLSLELTKGGVIYGSGYILDEDKRKSGWLVKLNEDGGFVWQRQHARGKSSELRVVAAYDDAHLIAAGVSAPYDLKTPESRNAGGWIGLFDESTGEPVWERFYSEPDHDLFIRDFIVHEDSQISVLMHADTNTNSPDKTQTFSRIVSLNARGAMLGSDVYLNGAGADGYNIFTGANNERIIVGGTVSPYTALVSDPEDNKKPLQEKKALAHQGWAIAVPGINPYEDPCE